MIESVCALVKLKRSCMLTLKDFKDFQIKKYKNLLADESKSDFSKRINNDRLNRALDTKDTYDISRSFATLMYLFNKTDEWKSILINKIWLSLGCAYEMLSHTFIQL